jgi:hypothetical protein
MSAGRLREHEPRGIRCSFCGTDHRDAELLISGPRVYICLECIKTCLAIVAGRARWVRVESQGNTAWLCIGPDWDNVDEENMDDVVGELVAGAPEVFS